MRCEGRSQETRNRGNPNPSEYCEPSPLAVLRPWSRVELTRVAKRDECGEVDKLEIIVAINPLMSSTQCIILFDDTREYPTWYDGATRLHGSGRLYHGSVSASARRPPARSARDSRPNPLSPVGGHERDVSQGAPQSRQRGNSGSRQDPVRAPSALRQGFVIYVSHPR